MKLHLLPLALLAPLGAGAQTLVTGVLADSLNRSGEPYATVRLLSPKGTVISSFLTDANGNFSKTFQEKGAHTLTFSAVGRKTLVRPIELGAPTLQLDTLLIASTETTLGTATVVAQKPLVKMETDKMTYDMENDAEAKNFTLLDMLRKVPLVMVDGQDNITVNGSSNFIVYVDGKPNPMFQNNASQVMKSIPASYVKKVEVLTNPGARFDAEGVGGVLNLITQSDASGTQQSLDGYSGNIGGRISTKHGAMTDAFLSLQHKKLTLTFNLAQNFMRIKGIEGDFLREQTISGGGTNTVSMHFQQNMRQYYSLFGATAAYQIDKENLVSLSLGLNRWAERKNTDYDNGFNNSTYGSILRYNSTMGERATNWTGYLSADYQRSSKTVPGRLLTLSYQFNFLPTTPYSETHFNGTTSPLFNLTNRYSNGDNKTTEHIGQVDYTTPFSKVHKMSIGVKFTARTNHAQTDYFFDNGAGTYNYNVAGSTNYKEYSKIGALYAEYESSLKSFTFKAGLRYEHTWLEEKFLLGSSRDFKVNYGNLVPNATISWAMRQGQNLGISYTQRISRPGLDFMNPTVNQSSPISRSFGNVNLDAERHHNLSLVYNFFSPKFYLNAQLSHHFTNNGISEYSFMDGVIQSTTYGNFNRERSEELSLFMNVNATAGTRIYSNLAGCYIDLRSDAISAHNHGWTSRVMLGLQQDLPWRLKFSTNIFWNSRGYTLQGNTSSFTGMVVSLNRTFLKDKLDVGAFVFTPLSNGIRNNSSTWGSDFTQSLRVHVPIRIFGISLRYNFGNRKIKTPTIERTIQGSDVLKKEQSTGIPSGVM